ATPSATPPAVDSTAPTGAVTINSGAVSLHAALPILGLSATDAVGVTGYYLATSATAPLATAAGWVAVPTTPSYSGSVGSTLSPGDGTKTVYAWFKDAAGNVSAAASGTILLDQTAPSNGTATAVAASAQVTVSWAGFADGGSGLATAPYTLVAGAGSVPASCTSGTVLVTGSGTSFTHTGLTNGTTYGYRVCATDAVGNASSGVTASATPQATPPSGGGEVLWVQAFNGTSIKTVQAVAVGRSPAGNGNLVVVGSFRGTVDFGTDSLTSAGSGDIYIVKYAAAGTPVWAKRLGANL